MVEKKDWKKRKREKGKKKRTCNVDLQLDCLFWKTKKDPVPSSPPQIFQRSVCNDLTATKGAGQGKKKRGKKKIKKADTLILFFQRGFLFLSYFLSFFFSFLPSCCSLSQAGVVFPSSSSSPCS